jgi:membrane fusion protein (multidrug efflux system)
VDTSDSPSRTPRLDSVRAGESEPAPGRGPVPPQPGEPERAAAPGTREMRRPWFRRRGVLLGGGILLVLVVLGGVYWWWYQSRYVSTDDAFLDAHIERLSPRVAGLVTAVLVEDNQLVHTGQVLVRLDPSTYQVALQRALAGRQQAQTALGEAQANVTVAQASLAQASANVANARASYVRAAADLRRYDSLRRVNPQAVSRSSVDQAVAAERSAAAELRALQQRVRGTQAQIDAAQAAVAGARANVATANAAVRQARLNLSYTSIAAPETGHVANRTVAIGNYVAPGEQMLAVVPLRLWVTANFKETEIDQIRPGERVTVHIDACPRADARGHVDSIQRGAGQAFDLLPPQNATGNYIKIVQRVPVRIALDSIPSGCVLGPGMSVEPTVKVG